MSVRLPLATSRVGSVAERLRSSGCISIRMVRSNRSNRHPKASCFRLPNKELQRRETDVAVLHAVGAFPNLLRRSLDVSLVQRQAEDGTRQVAAWVGDAWRIVDRHGNIRDLALAAIGANRSLGEEVLASGLLSPVDAEADLLSGRLLAPIDPPDPAQLWLPGTGLA